MHNGFTSLLQNLPLPSQIPWFPPVWPCDCCLHGGSLVSYGLLSQIRLNWFGQPFSAGASWFVGRASFTVLLIFLHLYRHSTGAGWAGITNRWYFMSRQHTEVPSPSIAAFIDFCSSSQVHPVCECRSFRSSHILGRVCPLPYADNLRPYLFAYYATD